MFSTYAHNDSSMEKAERFLYKDVFLALKKQESYRFPLFVKTMMENPKVTACVNFVHGCSSSHMNALINFDIGMYTHYLDNFDPVLLTDYKSAQTLFQYFPRSMELSWDPLNEVCAAVATSNETMENLKITLKYVNSSTNNRILISCTTDVLMFPSRDWAKEAEMFIKSPKSGKCISCHNSKKLETVHECFSMLNTGSACCRRVDEGVHQLFSLMHEWMGKIKSPSNKLHAQSYQQAKELALPLQRYMCVSSVFSVGELCCKEINAYNVIDLESRLDVIFDIFKKSMCKNELVKDRTHYDMMAISFCCTFLAEYCRRNAIRQGATKSDVFMCYVVLKKICDFTGKNIPTNLSCVLRRQLFYSCHYIAKYVFVAKDGHPPAAPPPVNVDSQETLMYQSQPEQNWINYDNLMNNLNLALLDIRSDHSVPNALGLVAEFGCILGNCHFCEMLLENAIRTSPISIKELQIHGNTFIHILCEMYNRGKMNYDMFQSYVDLLITYGNNDLLFQGSAEGLLPEFILGKDKKAASMMREKRLLTIKEKLT